MHILILLCAWRPNIDLKYTVIYFAASNLTVDIDWDYNGDTESEYLDLLNGTYDYKQYRFYDPDPAYIVHWQLTNPVKQQNITTTIEVQMPLEDMSATTPSLLILPFNENADIG